MLGANRIQKDKYTEECSMSYNVITSQVQGTQEEVDNSKADSERITEAGTLFVGQQWFLETINLGGGN